MLPQALHDQAVRRHADIQDWAGCFAPDGTAMLWDPVTGKCLENPVTFGVPYMLKLKHEVNHKIHSRAGMLEEEYSQISKQPLGGAAKGGGERVGEMEMCALAAYGAVDFLYETCNASSDNIMERINTTLSILNLPEHMRSGIYTPHAVEMLRYYLEVLGYKLVDDRGILPPADREAADSRTIPDIRSILSKKNESVDVGSVSLADQLKGEFG